MRLDPPPRSGVSRPAPRDRNKPSTSGPSQVKAPVVGGKMATQKAAALRAARRPKKPNARSLLSPDAATKRLIELTIDPTTGQMKAGAGGGQVLGTMAANLANRKGQAGTRSYLAFASVGIPMASMGDAARKNAAEYLKKLAADGIDLSDVPQVEVLDRGERDSIRAILKQRGTDPGDSATDVQLLLATKKRKPENIDILKNIPSSAVNTLVGVPVGTWNAGQAAGELAFNRNPEPLKQMGKGMAGYYENIARDPLRALQTDPVGTVSAVLPAKTLIGGPGGAIARKGALGKSLKGFATAQRADLPLPAIRTVEGAKPQTIAAKGMPVLRENLIDRAAQRALEGVTTRSAPYQRYRLKKQVIRENAVATAETYQIRDAMLKGLQEARRGASKEERRAILAYAQGETPSRLAAYYRELIKTEPESRWNKQREAHARIWEKVARKTGDSPTPRVAAYLEELKIPLARREEIMTRIGKVPEEQIAARRGIVTDEVSRVLSTRDRSPVAGMAQYVPHVDTAPQYGNFLVRRGLNPEKKLAPSSKKNELVLFKRGTWQPDSRILESSIAQASNVEQMRGTIERNLSQYGRVGTPGEAYEGTLIRLPVKGERRVMQPDQAGPALADTLRELYERSDGASEADLIAALEQQLIVTRRDNRIPDDGATYVVIPEAVGKQLRGEFGQHRRGAAMRAASTATDAWRYGTLFARPAWMVANAISNPIQAAIGMSSSPQAAARIPLAYARALSGKRVPGTDMHLPGRNYIDAIPAGLREAGWFSDLTKIQHAGANADRGIGKFITNVANSTEGRAIRRVVGFGPRALVNANRAWENVVRDATYLHQAVPEAKKAVAGTKYAKVTDDVMAYLENNEIPRAAELVRDTLGDMRKKNRPNVRIIAPFYRWLLFSSKFSLLTLPVKMPIRNELIRALGRDGMAEIEKLGGIPDYMRGAIPFDPEERTAEDGETHSFSKLLATRNINTLGSPAEFLRTNDDGMPTLAGALGYLNPFLLSSPLSTAFGKDLESGYALRDAEGKELPSADEMGFSQFFKTLLNQTVRTFPGVNLLSDPTGQAADALPFFAGEPREPSGLRQPKRSRAAKIATYLTGINVREADLTLYNVQWMYFFLDPANQDDIDEDTAKAIRKRLNRLRGKSGPYAKQQRDAKKANESQQLPAVSITVPTISVPELSDLPDLTP